MGKKAKEHRKKVQNRNNRIQNENKAFMKAYREAMTLQAQMTATPQVSTTRPEGNYLQLTGAVLDQPQ